MLGPSGRWCSCACNSSESSFIGQISGSSLSPNRWPITGTTVRVACNPNRLIATAIIGNTKPASRVCVSEEAGLGGINKSLPRALPLRPPVACGKKSANAIGAADREQRVRVECGRRLTRTRRPATARRCAACPAAWSLTEPEIQSAREAGSSSGVAVVQIERRVFLDELRQHRHLVECRATRPGSHCSIRIDEFGCGAAEPDQSEQPELPITRNGRVPTNSPGDRPGGNCERERRQPAEHAAMDVRPDEIDRNQPGQPPRANSALASKSHRKAIVLARSRPSWRGAAERGSARNSRPRPVRRAPSPTPGAGRSASGERRAR